MHPAVDKAHTECDRGFQWNEEPMRDHPNGRDIE